MTRLAKAIAVLALLAFFGPMSSSARGTEPPADAALLLLPQGSASPRITGKKPVARIWRGRTLTSKADEYQAYLFASGISRVRQTPGNLGVTVLRRADGKETEFLVISIWESIEAVKRFAGKDYQKAVILDRDREYLLEVEPHVRHYEIEKEERRRP
ncbi:MAG: antibiotic biosynthesis monooxygenase family protein [Acidobacteriota bacterium]